MIPGKGQGNIKRAWNVCARNKEMLNEWRGNIKERKTHKAQRTPNGQIRGNLSIKLVMTAMKYNPLNEIVSTDI